MEKILDLQNQSSLAKLLATENITVTHSKSLSTAYFDVKNRVLGLPVWKDKGKVVYDMLVGHEVSHALYTDHAEFEKFIEEEGRGNFDILNIIEDIRIERLIKIKYAGMPRIFNGAYKQLVEADFFGTADKDIAALSFLDRLNLHAKVGPFVDVPLNPIEEDNFNRCLQAETFDDVVKLYHEVKKFMNDQKKEEQPQDDDEQSTEEEQSKGDSDETSEDTPVDESPNESSDDSSADNI
jgi:Sec-independent protein translocase protein TatA